MEQEVLHDLRAEVQSLRLEIEELRVGLAAKCDVVALDSVRADVAQLREEIGASRSTDERSNTKTNVVSKASKKSKAIQLREEVHSATPITYEDAFEAIGGNEELQKHVELSRELQESVTNHELEAELKTLLPSDRSKRTGFSTNLVNQRFVRNLDELYTHANDIYPDFDEAIRGLAQKTNGQALIPPIKGEVRARMKALFKYREDASDAIAWHRLTDLVRATLQYKDIRSLYAGLKMVLEFFGDSVKEFNDRYQRPLDGGYRDMQLVIEFRGHMCELQLSTEPMTRAKETTGHRDFEVVRELKAAVKAGDLNRVVNALEFGREHLGASAGDGSSALRELLRSETGNTLLHGAAKAGHADIIHALLLHGADANAQDADGETPLHLAVFNGYERSVWVLLENGHADLDIENSNEQTALIKGYLMLWQRPSESAVRAVATIAQLAGAQRIKASRAKMDEHIRRMLHPSSMLVSHAADGNLDKMLEELRSYADPDSKDRDGLSALVAAASNGHVEAVEVLREFNASLTLLSIGELTALDFSVKKLLDVGFTLAGVRRVMPPIQLVVKEEPARCDSVDQNGWVLCAHSYGFRDQRDAHSARTIVAKEAHNRGEATTTWSLDPQASGGFKIRVHDESQKYDGRDLNGWFLCSPRVYDGDKREDHTTYTAVTANENEATVWSIQAQASGGFKIVVKEEPMKADDVDQAGWSLCAHRFYGNDKREAHTTYTITSRDGYQAAVWIFRPPP